MSDFIPSDNFRIVKFNFHEFGNATGVHIWNHPTPCVLLRVDDTILTAPDMWARIHRAWVCHWRDYVLPETKICPECGAFLRISQRLYKGRAFCQQCGTHLAEAESMGVFWIEAK